MGPPAHAGKSGSEKDLRQVRWVDGWRAGRATLDLRLFRLEVARKVSVYSESSAQLL